MRSYVILIFLAIFGAILSIFTSFGTFPDMDIPTVAFQMSADQISAFTDGALNTPWNSITVIGGTVVNVLLTSLGSVILLAILLVSIGVPPVIAWSIQGVIYIVYMWDVVTWIMNRPKPR